MEQELLRSIIQTNWNIPCITIEEITDTAWDINEQYVIKKYSSEKELQRNIILMELLPKKQIPTGEIIVSVAGLKYVKMNDTYLLLTRKLQGKNVMSIKERPGIARQMGKIIGNLHSALAVCEDELEIWDNSLLEEMKGWIYESLNKHNWKLISEADFNNTLVHLEEFYDKLPRQIIHRDVHFGNFLFDEGKFSGYIDFDLSQRNIRIFDVCYFCLGLLVEEENQMSQEEWLQVVRETIEGYGEVAAVTVEEKKVIPYVMQSIEILFVAYFLNEEDEACAMDARDIYKMLLGIEKEKKNMNKYQMKKIVDNPALVDNAANWFHAKWGIPLEAYLESMQECLSGQGAVPQWYVVLDNSQIIAGLGVIENDFHDRKDLTPNVCAVYVEEKYRCQGIAGEMLQYVCKDMKEKGIDTLYLVTDHTSFYERYNWKFFCMVQGDGESDMSRMYIHQEN